MEKNVNDFSKTIMELVVRSKKMDNEETSERLIQLEKQYAKLKSLVADRHAKLDELVELARFRRQLDEVERWIREKEMIASNEDTGEKLEHTLILIERWESFCAETKSIGNDKVKGVKEEASRLIDNGHTHAFKVHSTTFYGQIFT